MKVLTPAARRALRWVWNREGPVPEPALLNLMEREGLVQISKRSWELTDKGAAEMRDSVK